jgi:uncharacterized membrane protein YedE/YeeE
MNPLGALVAGLLFGIGLLVSGMNDPDRVLSFLDISGHWNPALAFTMAGAITVAAPAFWLIRRRGRALDGEVLEHPAARRVDGSLVIGSVLFGLGWGLSGICPGPAVLLLFSGGVAAWILGAAVALGMYAAQLWPKHKLNGE